MAKRKREEETVGDVLKSFIGNSKLEKGLNKIDAELAWHEVMGNAISKYTNKVYLERDTLYVQLSSAVLREELSYGKTKIISLLNEKLGKEMIGKLILK